MTGGGGGDRSSSVTSCRADPSLNAGAGQSPLSMPGLTVRQSMTGGIGPAQRGQNNVRYHSSSTFFAHSALICAGFPGLLPAGRDQAAGQAGEGRMHTVPLGTNAASTCLLSAFAAAMFLLFYLSIYCHLFMHLFSIHFYIDFYHLFICLFFILFNITVGRFNEHAQTSLLPLKHARAYVIIIMK